jgi:transcriptional/translational regulatory protein YebC/TACO1
METLADNKNRTVGEIRRILTKWAGNLGAANSVAPVPQAQRDLHRQGEGERRDALMEALLEAGADDLRATTAGRGRSCRRRRITPQSSRAVKKLGIERAEQRRSRHGPSEHQASSRASGSAQMLKLMEALEDHDDTKTSPVQLRRRREEIEASLA